jgi:hypothetical protein
MLKFNSYLLRRPNGKLRKPHLSYSKNIMCDDVTYKPCGYFHEFVLGWLVIHVLQYE